MKSISIALMMASWLVMNAVIADDSSGDSFLGSVFKSHHKKDYSLSVGVKTWLNKWNLPTDYEAGGDKSEQNLVIPFNSDTKVVFIPALNVRAKNFFISGSYFPKTEYSFGEQLLDAPFSTPSDGNLVYFDDNFSRGPIIIGGGVAAVKIPLPISVSAERSEWDINMGYFVHRSLVITAGYKRIDRQFHLGSQLPNDFTMTMVDGSTGEQLTLGINEMKELGIDTTFKDEADNHTNGITLGVASVVPIARRVALYGSFAFGWLDTKSKSTEYNSDYYLGELGLSYFYSLPENNIPLFLNTAAISLGYRFQMLNDNYSSGLEGTDSTEGFVLGVNLTF